MWNVIWSFVIYSVAVFATAYVLPGVRIKSFGTAIVVALLLLLAKFTVSPILHLLAFPITFLTLGLFSVVINAAVIKIVDYFIDDFEIDGFGWAIAYSLVLGIINGLLKFIF